MTFNPAQPALLREESVAYSVVDRDVAAAFRTRLAAAPQDLDLRATPGFPIASDEAFLALSDPLTGTACFKPVLPEMLAATRFSAELSRPRCTGQLTRYWGRLSL